MHRSYKGSTCSDAALVSVQVEAVPPFSDHATIFNASSSQMPQCVNGEVTWVSYVPWASYPVSIYRNHQCSSDSSGNYSSRMSCDWVTPNPVLSLHFPNDLNPLLPNKTSYYVIVDIFSGEDGSCNGNHDSMAGIILNHCYMQNGTYSMLRYDGRCAYVT